MIEKKFVKHCEIGELKFDIAINRSMAIKGFEKYPNYWKCLNESEVLKDFISNNSNSDDIEISQISLDKTIQLFELHDIMDENQENIVNYLLPQMLEFAETNIPDELGCYGNYANYILEYCEENNVLRNYIVENVNENNEIVAYETQGFYTKVMEFITKGFTLGGEKKKSAVKIIMN